MEWPSSCGLPVLVIWMHCSLCLAVTVKSSRHKVEVREFADAELSCQFHTELEQNPRIEWKKKGRDVSFVYYDGHFKGSFEGRASIQGATVTLHRVTQRDAGEYRCEISAPLDPVSLAETNVTLRVLVPPQTPLCEIPSSAVTGSVVQLRCRDHQSIPPATYSWYKNNQPLATPRRANATYQVDSHSGTLEFKAVSKDDSGQYRCLAANDVGSPKMCDGNHMSIEDVNVGAVLAAVLVCLLVLLVACGALLLYRNGLLSRHRGRSFWISECRDASPISSQTLNTSNVNYVPPPQEPQDFKHTQSFML